MESWSPLSAHIECRSFHRDLKKMKSFEFWLSLFQICFWFKYIFHLSLHTKSVYTHISDIFRENQLNKHCKKKICFNLDFYYIQRKQIGANIIFFHDFLHIKKVVGFVGKF